MASTQIKNVISGYGITSNIVCDKGSQFMSSLRRDFLITEKTKNNNKKVKILYKKSPQNLWVSVVLHLILVRLLCIQPEAFPGPRPSRSARPLLSRRLAYRRD